MLKPLWPFHSEDEIDAVADVLRSGRTNFWNGEHGQLFEQEFAAYTGAAHALAVTNGTTALELALHAALPEFPHVWNVIVPCRTFVATASAVVNSGMKVVLADIDPATLNVTVETLEARRLEIEARNQLCHAVIVVHYAGLPCDMPAICAWADEHNIIVVEDAAHAHGARINGQHVGTFGDIGCFSFCVGKIMSTGGEGGMVITNDPVAHKKMAARRDHGRAQIVGSKDMTNFIFSVEDYGSNCRMTEMQSVIGRLQLKKLDGWVARRNQIAERYEEIYPGQTIPNGYKHARYMHCGFIDNRDVFIARLNDRGVAARLSGCPNIGKEPVFRGTAAECPQADFIGARVMGLPVYPTLTDERVSEICQIVTEEIRACS